MVTIFRNSNYFQKNTILRNFSFIWECINYFDLTENINSSTNIKIYELNMKVCNLNIEVHGLWRL